MSTATPCRSLIAGICLLLPITALTAEADGAALFRDHCSSCHGLTRSGPFTAVKDFTRDRAVAERVIVAGEKLMPGFGSQLSAAEIAALPDYLQAQWD
jgi:dihydro-heme d1 dehydrogenase